jgi:hypothetical protein
VSLRLRTARPEDIRDIRRVFRATFALGHPAPLGVGAALLAPYERFCLDWYLDAGPDAAAVLCAGKRIVGYALVCVDPEAFARWQRRAALRFTARVVPRLVLRRYPAPLGRFYRLRLRDGWALWRAHDDRVAGRPHAHLNACDTTGSLAGRILADHVDAVVARAGFDTWYGEMDGGSPVSAAGEARSSPAGPTPRSPGSPARRSSA